jgi:hypothetical protein
MDGEVLVLANGLDVGLSVVEEDDNEAFEAPCSV